ncbi:MAG: TatD family hydrolase [Archangium sp.]|nr:TatD family hydrolase [Archangium sp.]MDP3571838.1 TatD family hydrolase [Archangium sp.]
MIDTHCHLDVPRFDADREAVLERAWAAGVTGMVIPAIGPTAWEPLLAWPQRDARVQVGLGIHPQLLPSLPEADDERHLATLDSLLPGTAIAVGECGLDGPSEAGAPIERQLRVLHAHFELAKKHGLPLLVHCYRAHPHLQRYLKEHPIPEAGLLMHSYSGSADLTPFYVKAGCHFSFAGPVSFPEARRPLEALKKIPLERLMGETDAPDQAPHPHRGERSEPQYLPLIIDSMATYLGVELRERTAENARRFFRCTFESR